MDHHNIYPDGVPARGGGPERRLEPLADPGPSPTKVKTGLILKAGAGLQEGRALCCLVHARVHAGLSPTRSPAMISRPTKPIVRSTTRMLLLALSVVLLGTARAAGTSVSSCPLDKVLIQNGNSIVVDVRALGHCHNHKDVAPILKTASAKSSRGQIAMSSYLTHGRHKGPYKDSCRKGIMKSIRSSEDNGVVADVSLLICFCGLARTFTTEIVQNGNILTDGNPRAGFEFNEYVEHHSKTRVAY